MKLDEIFALTPIRTDYNFYNFKDILSSLYTAQGKKSSLNIMMENLDFTNEDIDTLALEQKIQIRFYMDEGDDKWGARLFSVYFDGQPCMLVKNNGRYYEDYDPYVADNGVMNKLEQYLISKFKIEANPQTYSLDQEIQDLNLVGSYNLDNHYNANLKPKYKNDDEVWAWVEENHLRPDYVQGYQGYVLTKVKLKEVYPLDPIKTYSGIQLERGWQGNNYLIMVLNENGKIKMGMQCNDELIVGRVSEIEKPEFAINNLVDKDGILPKDYIVKLEDILNNKFNSTIKHKLK